MLATLLTGAALTAALPWLFRRLPRATAWLPATFAAGITLYLIFQIPAVQAGAFLREDLAWAPTLGISLSLRLDGLGLLFSLLIAGIGVLVALYAAEYLKDDPRLGR
ncbi:MAG: NADH-quinone oxidoreductase subunit L, partial [Anaerolineae bacterium]|nr:NADH-quinone oxidoreductase subunit L [Anaerolineae bacterium]